MQASRILPHTIENNNFVKIGNPLTRREFLKRVAIFTAALAALPLGVSSDEIDHLWPDTQAYTPPDLPAFGPRERTVVIDACAQRIDKVWAAIEAFWGQVYYTRTQAPEEVNGLHLLHFECAMIRAMEALIKDIDHSDTDANGDFYQAATGRCKYYWCLKMSIEGRESDREVLQREIDSYSDNPAFAELQTLLDARFGEGA